jgi:Tol biopolymer transport system component
VTVGSGITRGRILITWRTLTDSAYVTVIPRFPIVGNRGSETGGRAVTLANIDGTGSSELVKSGDFSLAPHSVPGTPSVVYYQADPEYNASVWIVTPGQSPRVLASPANGFATAAWPSLSPDGQWVYFTGARSDVFVRSLWRIRTDGTQLESLGVYNRTARFETVSISPDGSTAAVPGDGGVKLVNVATKTSRVIPGNCHVPRYSPDGRQFACLVNDELAVMNVDGSGARTIPTDLPLYLRGYEEYAGIDWSPDGNWIIAQNISTGVQLVRVSDGVILPLSIGRAFTQVSFVR